MIELRDVSIYRGAWSLQHINWKVPRGEYTVLMGTTGAGKSTLLEALCGLTPVHSGQVFIHDVDVTSASPAARRIGYVPQDLALFPTMTVRQHLEFGPRIRRWKPEHIRNRVAELALFWN
jgi:ABC-type sugar transport system ATPase subunit